MFWNSVQRRIRVTLYTVRIRDVLATIRPVVYLPFAFLLLSIPLFVYVIWSEINPDEDGSENREESIVKSVCFNLLALRGRLSHYFCKQAYTYLLQCNHCYMIKFIYVQTRFIFC